MTMTKNEVIDLLSLISAYDKRTAGQAEIHAFGDAAARGRWSFDEAAEAVKGHYAEETAWLMPAHITKRIKVWRSAPPRPHDLPQIGSKRADPEHIQRVVGWLANWMRADREARPDDHRAVTQTVACPFCGAEPGTRCGQTTLGRPKSRTPALDAPHVQRRWAYRDEVGLDAA